MHVFKASEGRTDHPDHFLGRMLSKKLEGFKMPPTSWLRYLNTYSRPFRGLLLDS